MSSFATDVHIEAPVLAVWSKLAAIGEIHRWNPGVVASHVTTEAAQGVGSARHCDLGGKNYVDEAVVEWEPGARLTMRVTGTNLPFKRADIRFRLEEEGSGTRLTVSPDYALKFGPVGRLLDLLIVRRRYSKGMRALLRGLQRDLESHAP